MCPPACRSISNHHSQQPLGPSGIAEERNHLLGFLLLCTSYHLALILELATSNASVSVFKIFISLSLLQTSLVTFSFSFLPSPLFPLSFSFPISFLSWPCSLPSFLAVINLYHDIVRFNSVLVNPLPGGNAQICCICPFRWCKYWYHVQVQAIYGSSFSSNLRRIELIWPL